MFEEEVPKYRKKSTAKGQPRSKHKHEYEVVLLKTNFEMNDFKTGKPKIIEHLRPTKVCTICGRVDYVVNDSKYYVLNRCDSYRDWLYSKDLSEEALKLPKWECNFFDKFAHRLDDNDD